MLIILEKKKQNCFIWELIGTKLETRALDFQIQKQLIYGMQALLNFFNYCKNYYNTKKI